MKVLEEVKAISAATEVAAENLVFFFDREEEEEVGVSSQKMKEGTCIMEVD